MYPVNLEITEKLCVVVGGGRVAERKVSGLLSEGAQVRIISPRLTEQLVQLADDKKIQWIERGYRTGDLAGAFLVFAATDSAGVQEKVLLDANAAGQLVNVIDQPAHCTFQVPASVRRGELTLTVSTHGKSPAVAAMIRQQMEDQYGVEYAVLLNMMSSLREYLFMHKESCEERKILFKNILDEDIVLWIKTGQWDRLRHHLHSVLGSETDFDFNFPGDNA